MDTEETEVEAGSETENAETNGAPEQAVPEAESVEQEPSNTVPVDLEVTDSVTEPEAPLPSIEAVTDEMLALSESLPRFTTELEGLDISTPPTADEPEAALDDTEPLPSFPEIDSSVPEVSEPVAPEALSRRTSAVEELPSPEAEPLEPFAAEEVPTSEAVEPLAPEVQPEPPLESVEPYIPEAIQLPEPDEEVEPIKPVEIIKPEDVIPIVEPPLPPEKETKEVEEARVQPIIVKEVKPDIEAGRKKVIEEEEITMTELLKEYLPWFSVAIVGCILLLVAVALLATATSGKKGLKVQTVRIPGYYGSMKIFSVEGEELKYSKKLKFIGSLSSRRLRNKIEPKLIEIYKAASLPVDTVLILVFKYGEAGKEGEGLENAVVDNSSESATGRLAEKSNKKSIIVRHWVYLTGNTTMEEDEVTEKVKIAAREAPGIAIDIDSIIVTELKNLTRVQTITLLSQYGFFRYGVGRLDLDLLATIGLIISPDLGVRSAGEGVCPVFSTEGPLLVTPNECKVAASIYLGMLCTFKCPGEYYLVGSTKRICLQSGHWSGYPAMCKKKCPPLQLGSPGNIFPLFCSTREVAAGQLCYTQCPASYRIYHPSVMTSVHSSSFIRECQDDGVWSGEVGFCKAMCPALRAPYNYNTTTGKCALKSLEGDACSLMCNPGFVLNGGGNEQQLTCDAKGIWNKKLLQCKKLCTPVQTVNTSLLVEPMNCAIEPFEGLKCSFSCAMGYKLVGKSMSICSAMGWTNMLPLCVRVCDTLPSVYHGHLVSLSGDCKAVMPYAETTCTSSCDWGFTAHPTTATCSNTTGMWTPSVPSCKRKCADLPDVASGYWSPTSCNTDAEPGSICELNCVDPHAIVGMAMLTCDGSTGLWSHVPGKCARTCANLTAPSNGAVMPIELCTQIAISQSKCHFSCNAGYVLIGTRTLMCNGDGTWSDSAPTCHIGSRQYTISTVYAMEEMCLTVDDNVVVKSSICSVTMEQNRWTVEGTNNIKSIYTNLCLAARSLTSYQLVLDTCDTVADLQYFSSGMQYLLMVANSTFVDVGPRTAKSPSLVPAAHVMSSSASWKFTNVLNMDSSAFHALQGERCQSFPLGLDMTAPSGCLSPPVIVSPCRISCDSGFHFTPSVTEMDVDCTNATGVYDISDDFKCVPTSLPSSTGCAAYPSYLLHGVTVNPPSCSTNRTNVGDECFFSCTDQLKYVDGPSSVRCNDDASWSVEKTSICKNSCPGIVMNDNSYLLPGSAATCKLGQAHSGDICRFACMHTFSLDGNSSYVTCLDSGEWDYPVPLCRKTCKPLSALDSNVVPSGGDCSNKMYGNRFGVEAICSLSCPPGYATTTSFAECHETGTWTNEDTLGCKAMCGAPTTVGVTVTPSGCQSNTVSAGTKCAFTCSQGEGFMIDGSFVQSRERVCGENGVWDGPYATCVKLCPAIQGALENAGYFEPMTCSMAAQGPGTVCHLRCQGLDVVYGAPSVTCSSEGIWTPPTLGVCSSPCEALTLPMFATVTPQYCVEGIVMPGTSCYINCPHHMERVGPGLLKCTGTAKGLDKGAWEPIAETKCVAKCPPLPRSPTMLIYPRHCVYTFRRQGDSCTFQCERGLRLIGPFSIECLASGLWSDVVPSCQRPCLNTALLNGQFYCSGMSAEATLVSTHLPGTRCNFACSADYAALVENDVTCSEQGLWTPDTFCERTVNSFVVFQKIKEKSKCLIAAWNSAHIGSDWVLTFETSSEKCISAGNNARWFWYGQHNLKHAHTGLCITAELERQESRIVLLPCDETDALQHWTCDSGHPFRLLLRGTDLSIDSTYEGVGPTLESFTHSKSYWITFNQDLETTATLCSYKAIGTCPKISISNVVVTPEVCKTDEVLLYQQCQLACFPGSTDLGGVTSVECLPTGVWKGIEATRCVVGCTALRKQNGKLYAPASCRQEVTAHGETCTLTCSTGYRLSSDEESATLLCNDGVWKGPDDISCDAYCANPPTQLENGQVVCNDTFCAFSCTPGYKLSDASLEVVVCMPRAQYPTCEAETQFMIRAKQLVGFTNSGLCLSLKKLEGDTDTAMAVKVSCVHSEEEMYKIFWRWKNDMLQHVDSGLCLYDEDDKDFGMLMATSCSEVNGKMAFACASDRHPYHVKSMDTNRLIDFGPSSPFTAPVMTKVNRGTTGEWIAKSSTGDAGSICSFKSTGKCPRIAAGPMTTVSGNCDVQVEDGDTCQVVCASGYVTTSGNTEYSMTCQADGTWNAIALPCVAQSDSDGECSAIMTGMGLKVAPTKCLTGQELYAGTQCTFSCESGYFLHGMGYSYCKDSNWTNPTPTCVAVCPGLPVNMYRFASPPECGLSIVPAGKVCHQRCAMGYASFMEENTKVCMSNGMWDGTEITCSLGCQRLGMETIGGTTDPDMIVNGSMKVLTSSECLMVGHRRGKMCSFSCPPGYALVKGAKMSICQSNGMWYPSIPECVQKYHCPAAIGSIKSVTYDPMYNGTAVIPGTVMFLTCNEGYTLKGDSERVCRKDGTWSGNGPTVPNCEKLCPPLLNRLLATITPARCVNEYSSNGETCQIVCTEGRTTTITCVNNQWSSNLQPCLFPDEDERGNGIYDDFMMVTRTPSLGCLYGDSRHMVQWRLSAGCVPSDDNNKWKWTDDGTIMNVGKQKCLQARTLNSEQYLGLVTCDNSIDQRFVCGNPESSSDWSYLFYAPSSTWEMTYERDVFTGLASMVSMTKETDSDDMRFNHKTISVRASGDVLNDEIEDRPVCAYACSRTITLAKADLGYLASPWFFKGQAYPPFTSCHWQIRSFNINVTLTLLELDLEGSAMSSNPCQMDCVRVYEGLSDNMLTSDLVRTFTGDDLMAYYPHHEVRSLGTLYVKFIADGKGNNKGFAFEYKYNKVPAPPALCGVPSGDNGSFPILETRKEPLLGSHPPIRKWPWLVSIRETKERVGKAYHRCAGVLANRGMVVSAAHCAKFAVKAMKREQGVTFAMGRKTQFYMDDDLQMGKVITLDKVFIHPHYSEQNRKNDIAVWLFKDVLREYNGVMKPVCLPFYGYPVASRVQDSICYSLGWTKLDNGVPVQDLTEYRMRIDPTNYCEKMFGLGANSGYICANHIRLDNSLVAGSGDSDVLICQVRNQWFLAGVGSHTRVGIVDTRRLYTSAFANAEWLKKTMESTAQKSYRSHGLEKLLMNGDEMLMYDSESWFKLYE